MNEVSDTSVTIHEPSRQRDDELRWCADRAERQALPWREAGRAKPFVQPRVPKLGRKHHSIRCMGFLSADAVGAAEHAQIGLDELAILGLEVDHPSPGYEAAVCRRESHDVGHLVGPRERKSCAGGKPPSTLLERGP